MPNQFADGVGFYFRVRVDSDHNFGVGLGHGRVQRPPLFRDLPDE